MRLTLITAATEDALSVDEVRDHLGLTGITDHDARLNALIRGAVNAFEQFTQTILVSSTWDMYLDSFPDESYFDLPSPLISVTTVKYQNTADVQTDMPIADYMYDIYSKPAARLALTSGASWPSTYGEINDVVVRFVAGYANAASIPQKIKDGLYLWIEGVFDGKASVRDAAEQFWWNYRWVPV